MDTQDRKLKEALVRILAAIGDERAAGRLLHACRDERLRSYCLQAFDSMGEAGAVSLLDAFSTADEDERCFIAYACGELRYEGCAPILAEGMRDAGPMLRRVSALVAGKMGLASLLGEIIPLLDDSEPEVRKGAIEALSRLAGHERGAVLTLAQMLVNDKLPEKRRDAAILLAALEDVEKLSLLIKDEDAVVRMAAVSSLARLRSMTSVGHLVMALVDENNDVRVAAAGALGEIGGAEVLEPLLLVLQDDDLWVRCAALKSLGKLKDERALQAIVRVRENADGMVMIAALEALAEIGGAVALYMVKQALDDPDEEVVKAAINILAVHGDDWLEEYADKLLAHYHWDVRSSFVRVMADIWGDRALPHLKAALARETDDLVRVRIMDVMDRLQ
jgi:HEAT repeat protein